MKYRNAADIFPDELLKEIQKYADGETIYIPVSQKRKNWGDTSGARKFYEQRNAEIRRRYFTENSVLLLSPRSMRFQRRQSEKYCTNRNDSKNLLLQFCSRRFRF